MSLEIIHTDDFVDSATERVMRVMESTLGRQEYCRLSLCGGSTPFPVYSRLAQVGKHLPWDRVIITFGDERCVPPDHEQSNFRSAKTKFLDSVPIPDGNILRMKGELSPEEAAADYERQMDVTSERLGMPTFTHDLLLLGIGEDGHTASLFPDTEALGITDRRVVANYVPKLRAHRITFTLPFINMADHVMFLANDAKKQEVVREAIAKKGRHPAGLVEPKGDLTWILGWIPS